MTDNNKTTDSKKTMPTLSIKDGNIEVNVWEHTNKDKLGKEFIGQTVSIKQNYKIDEKWDSTHNIAMNNIPKLILALTQIYLKR